MVDPPPLGHFLADTLDLAARLVPAEAGSLLLDDPLSRKSRERAPLTFVAAFGKAADALVGLKVPGGHGIVGKVYRSGETYVTREAPSDPHFFTRVDELSTFRTRSVVAAPVRLEKTVCGVLELVNRRGRADFSPHDMELVELLAEYISRAILNAVDILKQNELALFDELTTVRNVRGLEPYIDHEIARAERDGDDLSLLFFDVDRLKRLNDKLGHRAGSEVLRRTGRALHKALGERGEVFRFGGDEFVAVCPGMSVNEAVRAAADMSAAVTRGTAGPTDEGAVLPGMTISVGAASLRESLTERRGGGAARLGARLLRAADRALYRAKRSGRARVRRATRRDDMARAQPRAGGTEKNATLPRP